MRLKPKYDMLIDHYHRLIRLMSEMKFDMDKMFNKGNRSAARRVRVNSVLFDKAAKKFRKSSLEIEYKLKGVK